MKIEVFVDDIKWTKCKTTCVMVDGVPIEQLSEEEVLNLRLRLANKLRTSEDIDVRDIAGVMTCYVGTRSEKEHGYELDL